MSLFRYIMTACLFITSLNAYELVSPAPYIRNQNVPDEVWNAVSPYFVPEFSQEKAALDTIFSKKGVLKSLKSLSNAGFLIITNPKDKIIVLSHPFLKGYLLKVFTDGMNHTDWDVWRRRVEGANTIRDAINSHGYQHLMKVPNKWIYPIPSDPTPVKNGERKMNFILLVQKMDILNDTNNRKAYKRKVTPEILDALYTLLTQYLLIDSVYADNIPFCRDGKIAFVDTEYAGDTTREVPLSALGQYLSADMLAYWEQLIIR